MDLSVIRSHMEPGDKAEVKIPSQIPYPYFNFNPNWIDWVQKLHGHEVELETRDQMFFGQSALDGWIVEAPISPNTTTVTPWLPAEWIKPSCICETRILLWFGCQCKIKP